LSERRVLYSRELIRRISSEKQGVRIGGALMKVYYWVIALGIYMIAMGIVGYIRTGSPTALYVNNSFALMTLVFGFIALRGSLLFGKISLGWTGFLVLLMGYMTFKRVAAHANTKPGSELIFGSMALVALIVFILLMRNMLTAPTTSHL